MFCKNTGLFINSDKNLIDEKIIEIRRKAKLLQLLVNTPHSNTAY